MKLLKKFVSTALLAGAAATVSAATPLLNLVGDQAPLVISFNDVPSMINAYGESPWAKTWSDEQVRKFFAPLHTKMDFEKMDAEVKASTGYSIDELSGFVTGDVLVAFTSTDIDFESDDSRNNIPFVVAIELGANASKVEKMIAEARSKNPGTPHETEDFAGVTIHIETPKTEGEEKKKGPDHIVWAITDGVWLVGFNSQTVISTVDALKKGGAENAYGKSTEYLATKEKSGQSHVTFALNFKPIVARAQQEIAKKAAEGEQSNPFLNPVAIIPALGLDAWNQLYFNIHFNDAQTVATGGFTFSEERGLLKMFSYGKGPVARPAFVPAKWMAVSSGKFSLKNFYSGLEEMLGAYNPGMLGMGQMYVQNFNQQLGIDIKRDFFGSFGPDVISGYAPRAGAAKAASMNELDQFIGFSLDNPKAFTTALDALLKMGGPQAEQMIVKREFLGSTINTLAMPTTDGQPAKSFSYAIAKNYLMLSIGTAGAIESTLQSGPSFWERSEVKKALASIPGDASSFTYQDTSALIGTIFQSFVELASNPATQAQSPVDASAAPDVSTLSKYWGDTVGYLSRDSQGYFFKTTLEHKKVNRSRFTLRTAAIVVCAAHGLSAAQPSTPATPVVAFRGPEVVKLEWNTRALQVADLNGDGLADLAVANNDRSSIEILYQLKPGAPAEATPRSLGANRWEPVLEDARFRKTSVTTGVTVFDFVVGDLNGDGRADLAYTGEPQALTIRYQQADGTWVEKKISEAPEPIQFVGSLRLADVNGDKRMDLVILGQKEIAVFEQEKNGQLAVPERYALPDDNCYGLEVTDVNGDGRVDFVYLRNNTRDGLRVRLQTAAREFGPELAYAMKPSRCTLQILSPAKGKEPATFAFAQEATGQLEVFRLEQTPPTNGGLVLRPRVFSPRAGGKNPACYALGDFNGDKRIDVAVGDPDGAQVYLYLRQPDGGFTGAERYPVSADVRSLAAADWDGDGQDELFVGSPKEQSVGVAKFTNGRLVYPQPLPITGKPLGLAAGEIAADGRVLLAVIREEKNKRYAEVWARKDAGAELLKSIELTGLKTDPRALRLVDVNQDGRLDLAVFTPLDAMRLLVQGDAMEFTDLSSKPGFRKGLVDNLESSALTLGDLDGDGKSEIVTSVSSFARAMRINEQGELAVVDQFNARDSNAEVASTLILPQAGAKQPVVVLYDRKGEQFQILRANDKGLYEIADSTPTGKIDVITAETRVLAGGGTEAFIFGKDRFWWLPFGQADYAATTASTHATDLPDISYSDVIAGDFNNDGKPEIVCVDPGKNLLEILGRGKDDRWESLMHFKVFEIDQHYQGRKGSPMEPRETLIADVTDDGKKDLILLVHDRVLIYPRE